MSNQRSSFDKQMAQKFNPANRENYHAPPGNRTSQDTKLQKKWCPNCKSGSRENYTKPMLNFRTPFDKKLQLKWCPRCKRSGSLENYASTFHDNDSKWSYTVQPW